jgi:hypothetical protein
MMTSFIVIALSAELIVAYQTSYSFVTLLKCFTFFDVAEVLGERVAAKSKKEIYNIGANTNSYH